MVRVVAAEFLARSKDSAIRNRGIDQLVALALTAQEDSDASTIMLASSACHSLLNSQAGGKEFAERLSGLPVTPKAIPARYHPYLKDFMRTFQDRSDGVP